MNTISIISIPVTDQERAKQFYIKLGFELWADNQFNNQRWVQLGFPGSATSITLVNWFESMQPGSIRGLVIDVEDIEAEIKRLTENGIHVAPIDNTPWGNFATVKDPDGNALSLHQR